MRRLTTLFAILMLGTTALLAQAPEKFTYQAVVRNTDNQLVTNTQVGVQVLIMKDHPQGGEHVAYGEWHGTFTNANGLITLNIGEGNPFYGNFNQINWKSGVFFIDVGIDLNGGSDYTIWSTQQLLSVPFALYANEAGNSFSGDYNDLTNAPSIPIVPTNVSAFNNDAGYLTGYTETDPQFNAWDKDYNDLTNLPQIPQIPADISAFNNDVPYLTAEQQILSISHDTIFLTGGSFVKLPAGFDGDYNSLTNTPDLNQLTDSVMNIILIMQQQWQQQQMQMQQQIDSLNEQVSQIPHTENTTWNTSVTNEMVCDSLVWHGETYTESGIYLHGWTDAEGINNMEALNLTVHHPVAEFVEVTACESYSWNGTTYEESGDFQQTFMAASGCDSVVTLHLTIYNGTRNVFAADSCENYTWHGQTYTESGTYTYAYTNADGCASMDTLHLTIHHGTHNVDTVTACESYIWHDSTYTKNGIYTYVYENEYGCASVDTLYLTVHYGTHNVESLNACGSYEWHGQTYTESGTYTYAYNNEYGCPSVDTLKVVVVLVDEKSCSLAPCVTDVDGNMYSTVQIGGQCWMRSNLRTTHFPDGTSILYGGNDNPWSNTEPYYYEYSNCFTLEQRGYAYNWLAMTHGENGNDTSTIGIQGICPEGWHVPTNEEWTQLTDYISAQNNYICDNNNTYIAKALASNTAYWGNSNGTCPCCPSINQNENNATGFNAVPAASSTACYWRAGFWSSSFISNKDLYEYRIIQSHEPDVKSLSNYNVGNKSAPFAVRCVYDISACGTEFEGTHTVDTVTACDSYTWHGQTYTESGTYTYAYQNIYGCPSEDTLKLTLYQGCTIDEKSCPGTPILMDIDGNTYSTVQIDEQCWMRSNLRTTRYADGTAVPVGNSAFSETNPYYYDYSNQRFTLRERGYLYNWPAVMHNQSSSNTMPSDVQGICPDGWHLPSYAEWTELENYVKSQSQYRCGGNSNDIAKAMVSAYGWKNYNNTVSCLPGTDSVTNNATGFSAIPAGKCAYGSLSSCYEDCYLWSTTDYGNGSTTAYYRRLTYGNTNFPIGRDVKSYGCSVRCLKDTASSGGDTPCIGTHNLETESSCGNYTWHGQTYSESGTYTYAYTNNDGCASVDTLKLTILQAVTTTTSAIACESYTWNGQTYTQSGDYAQTFTAANGCDSVVTLHLTIYQPVATTSSATACESYTWHEQTYTQSGNYTYNYTNEYGCPCTETLQLTINHGSHNVFTETAEGSYTWHEQTYTTSGTYTYTYNNENDCPSVDTLHLTVSSVTPIDTLEDGQPCTGTPTVTDHEGNVYNTVLIGSQCWTKENIRCTTSPITGNNLLTDFSSSASKAASWHPNNASHDPAYGLLYNWCAALDTFKTTGGVPEVANANSSTTLYCTISGHRRGICPQGWHVPNDAEWAQLMAYVYNNGYRCNDCSYLSLSADFTSCIAKALSDTTGWNTDDGECVVGNDLSANNATGFSALPGGCYSSNSYRNYGQKAYFWSSDVSYGYADYAYLSYNYDEMTRIDERMSAKFSVRCLKDAFDCGTHNVETAMDCESYTWHGQTYNATGTYTYEYTNERGCASVDTLKLTIQEHVYLETSVTACNEYISNGQTFTSSGSYTYDFTNEHGCPSTETLNLTIYNSEYPTFSVSECESYTWHGQTYTSSGTYTYAYTNAYGCPCTETLNLTIYEPETSSTSASACESYTWHGQTYIVSGTYTYEFQDLHGCSGTETLNLTIYNGTHTVISAGDCEYYTWHDNNYDQSGTYTYAYTDEHGCDCTDTLKLVIQEHVNITSSVEACEYYVWRDSTYTESGTHIANYLNNHGCLTTETLILTIHHGTHNSYTEEVCSFYVWHDSTITQSGDYTYAYLDEHGCASVDTLHLTIGSNSCPGMPTVTDHEGNVYNTVQMGSQCWTKENMRCTTSPSTGTNQIGWYLNNDPSTAATFGLLYNWDAAMAICPQGWHLPSVTEWTQMLNYVKSQSEYWCGNNSNYIAKALASETGWVTGAAAANVMQQIASSFLTGVLIEVYEELGYFDLEGACAVCNDPSSNNATCFSALPAGYYFGPKDWDPDGFMSNCWANFFSSTSTSDTMAYGVGIFFFSSIVATASTPKHYGNSVRCVRNEAILPDEQ